MPLACKIITMVKKQRWVLSGFIILTRNSLFQGTQLLAVVKMVLWISCDKKQLELEEYNKSKSLI